jgi:DNA-binding response OmpR family regulator
MAVVQKNYKLTNLKILVVDDNDSMRFMIRTALHALGVEMVHDVGSASAAFAAIESFRPDIVITDWEMAPTDGIVLVKTLRADADPRKKFIPIIMLTGYGEEARVHEARDAGVNEYMVKPFTAKGLFNRLVSLIVSQRHFIRLNGYFGPDRRRRETRYLGGNRRLRAPLVLPLANSVMTPIKGSGFAPTAGA